MTEISSSSYEFEEKKWLVDLSGTIKDLNNNQSANAEAMQVEFVYPDNLFEDTVFDNSERNLIFHIGGYVMRSVAKNYLYSMRSLLLAITKQISIFTVFHQIYYFKRLYRALADIRHRTGLYVLRGIREDFPGQHKPFGCIKL